MKAKKVHTLQPDSICVYSNPFSKWRRRCEPNSQKARLQDYLRVMRANGNPVANSHLMDYLPLEKISAKSLLAQGVRKPGAESGILSLARMITVPLFKLHPAQQCTLIPFAR